MFSGIGGGFDESVLSFVSFLLALIFTVMIESPPVVGVSFLADASLRFLVSDNSFRYWLFTPEYVEGVRREA